MTFATTYHKIVRHNPDVDMTDNTTSRVVEGLKASDNNNRRRQSDVVQPLDYETRELVGDIIENLQQAKPAPKSFIQKLIKND